MSQVLNVGTPNSELMVVEICVPLRLSKFGYCYWLSDGLIRDN